MSQVQIGAQPGAVERRKAVRGAATVAAAVAAVVVGVVGSHLSIAILVVAAALLSIIVAYGSLTWPRPALVIVALTPILDRYLAPGVIDPRAETLAHFLSEWLLLVVGAVLVTQAIRRGTLIRALWHPTTALLAVFGLVSIASAVVNAVSPTQALAGIIFTIDAVAFFLLARIVGFTDGQAGRAIGAFVVLMLIAAVVAVAQALLSPNLFGLFALQGKFGEVYRLASFFGDPNVFATLLSAAVPFLLFGLRGQPTRQRTVLVLIASCVMLMALLLSFSRGGWFGGDRGVRRCWRAARSAGAADGRGPDRGHVRGGDRHAARPAGRLRRSARPAGLDLRPDRCGRRGA